MNDSQTLASSPSIEIPPASASAQELVAKWVSRLTILRDQESNPVRFALMYGEISTVLVANCLFHGIINEAEEHFMTSSSVHSFLNTLQARYGVGFHPPAFQAIAANW